MSQLPPDDPRLDPAAQSDDALLDAHEKLLGRQPDDHARYQLLPLVMLFVVSGCILFAATYLNRYSGHFDPAIYNENLLPSKNAPVAIKVDPIAQGLRVFNTPGYCATCHQPTGQGIPGVYPPLAGSEWVNGPDARVIRIVLDGLQGPVHVEGKAFGTAVMPAFGPSGFNLSDEQIAAVLTYVRQQWTNKSPAITEDEVAKIHQQVADHKAWSEAELLQVK
jgi:mono/diheme cytochrome c family protein